MTATGPSIAHLTHRLANAPAAVTNEPASAPDMPEVLTTAAMISDMIDGLGGGLLTMREATAVTALRTKAGDRIMLMLQAAAFLAADPWFVDYARAHPDADLAAKTKSFLMNGLTELSKYVKPDYLVGDPEGREELARRYLAALDLVPEGETAAQAADRLTALDSVERARLIGATRESQKRARELREAMARREAEEAASKMTRE
ncbi:MAG TPA: hypothetical protein PKM65_15985 [Spirochaetota bacterium]|nr:hypothetical protein [Spirochaetota bacterium]HNT11846.1 hypothetical protein [Spirochaetota bacterium]